MKLSIIITLIPLLMSCGFDEHSTTKPWETHSSSHKLPYGIYNVDIQVTKDECEPSLSQIINENAEWPPKNTITYGSRNSFKSRIIFPLYELRTGEIFHNYIPTSHSGYPAPLYKQFGDVDDNLYIDLDRCKLAGIENGRVQIETTSQINEMGHLVVHHKTKWVRDWDKDWMNCKQVDQLEDWRWNPKQSCEESYTTTYKIVSPCDDDKLFLTGSFLRKTAKNGGSYWVSNLESYSDHCFSNDEE